MKQTKIRFLFPLLVLCLTFSICKAERADSLLLGNCYKQTVNSQQVANSDKWGGSALYYPATTMGTYKNCTIKTININASASIPAKIFVSKSLTGTPDYVQEVTLRKNGWNRIVLDTPYLIDGDSLYIGYMVQGVRLINYTECKENNEEWIYNFENKWSKFTKGYSAALYAVIEGGDNLPLYNVRLKNEVMPKYSLTNTDFGYEAYISNLAAETITSLEFTTYLGNKTVSTTLDNLNIPFGEVEHLTIPGTQESANGEYDLKFAVTKINGHADLDMSDNTSRTSSIICRDEFTKRKSLLELFTSEKCTNCPSEHDYVTKNIEANDNIIEISHHVGFIYDSCTLEDSKDLEYFFIRQYNPAIMMDRLYDVPNYPSLYSDETPMIGISSKTFPLLKSISTAAPAYASINLAVKETETPRNIKISVSGKKLLPISPDTHTRLNVWLTEDSIFTPVQAGSLKNYYHRNVARGCLTSANGKEIDIANGYSDEFEFTVPDNWNIKNVAVVAYISKYDPDDITNAPIYNSERVKLKDVIHSGVTNIATDKEPLYHIDGNRITILSDNVTLSIYNTSGACVASGKYNKNESFDNATLANGCYIARISTVNKVSTIKFIN